MVVDGPNCMVDAYCMVGVRLLSVQVKPNRGKELFRFIQAQFCKRPGLGDL